MRHPQQAGHDSLGDADGGTPHPRAPPATPFASPKERHPRDTSGWWQEGLTLTPAGSDQARQAGRAG
jgi:hypothetical protein